MAYIIIADDDTALGTVLSRALTRAGHVVQVTTTGAGLWQAVADGKGDLVITDVMMPDVNGLDLVPRIKKARPDLNVLVMSAHNTLMTAVKANEVGAFDYLPKPFDLKKLLSLVENALAVKTTDQQSKTVDSTIGDTIIGRSQPMQDIYRTMARLMATDMTVLVTGESGTGKELVARALHDHGKRQKGPFVAINCAAVPRDLIESELFGHEKGAFTGATTQKQGRFAQAQGGTLFLDEIGDMPMDTQTSLLRVLQEGTYTPVGGLRSHQTNVRIITATHHNLEKLVTQNAFREDLYYRLNVVHIHVPPLRERKMDIPELVHHFVHTMAKEGFAQKAVSDDLMQTLQQSHWPGNVRELENTIRRLVVMSNGDILDKDLMHNNHAIDNVGENFIEMVDRHVAAFFKSHQGTLPPSGLYSRIIREVEVPIITHTLRATGGNQIKAADILGLNRNTLRKKIKELSIKKD